MTQNENKEIVPADFQFANPQDDDYQEIINSLPQFVANRAQRRAAKKLENKANKVMRTHSDSIAGVAKKLAYKQVIEKLQETKKQWQNELKGEDDNYEDTN